MKKLSFSSYFFLTVVLIFGLLSYLLFGEVFYYRMTEQSEDVLKLSFPTKKDSENRAKAKFPKEFDFSFPRKFDSFFNDAFPFRSKLIKRFFKLRLIIGDNPGVIPGKESWFFFNSSPLDIYAKTSNTLGDFTGKTLLNPEDRETLKRHMACQNDFFKKHHIRLIVMIPPNRKPVYPEFLPEVYKKQGAKYGRYEQVQDLLKELNIDFVDEKKALIANKDKGTLYFKTDTHWTLLGAHYGFEALAEFMGYKMPPVDGVKRKIIECGDMYRMSASIVHSCYDINDIPVLPPTDAPGSCEHEPHNKRVVCTNDKAPIRQKVVIVRDSMFDSLYEDVARTFKKAVLLWRSKHTEQELKDEILREKPDTLIYEQGERFMLEMQNEAICPDNVIKINRLDQRPPEEANIKDKK